MNKTPTLATVHSLAGRTKNGDAMERALASAGSRADDARYALTHQLAPLLALCEFASLAHASLSEIVSESERDPALAERLNEVSPGWSECLDLADTMRNIGRCMSLAMAAQARAAGELQALTDEADAATVPRG